MLREAIVLRVLPNHYPHSASRTNKLINSSFLHPDIIPLLIHDFKYSVRFKPVPCNLLKARVLFLNSNAVGVKKMRPYIGGNDITPKNAPAAVPISPSCTVYQGLTINRLSPKLLCICSSKLASFCGVLGGRYRGRRRGR